MTSEDLTRDLCALWDRRDRKGHSSPFDTEKHSLEERVIFWKEP